MLHGTAPFKPALDVCIISSEQVRNSPFRIVQICTISVRTMLFAFFADNKYSQQHHFLNIIYNGTLGCDSLLHNFSQTRAIE